MWQRSYGNSNPEKGPSQPMGTGGWDKHVHSPRDFGEMTEYTSPNIMTNNLCWSTEAWRQSQGMPSDF